MTTRASTSISRNTKKRDNNHKTDLDQTPSTTKVGNIQTHTRAKTKPEGTTENKKNYLCRPQHHIKYQTPKKKKKWNQSTKPGHTKIRPQQPNPGEPKEQPSQLQYKITLIK